MRMCTVLAFKLDLRWTQEQPVPGSKIVRKADQEKFRKNRVGAGERRSIVEHVSIALITSFRYTSTCYAQ